MAGQGTPGQASCDRCRQRKVKCIPLESDELEAARSKGFGDRCKGCYRSNTACTRDYVHKKPGRPLGSGGSRSKRGVSDAAGGGSGTATARRSASPPTSSSRQVDHPEQPALLLTSTATDVPAAVDPLLLGDNGGPAFGTIFGSARAAMYPTHTYGHPILDELVLQQEGLDANGGTVITEPVVNTASSTIWRPEPPQSVAPSQSVSQHHDHTSAPSLHTPIDFGGGKDYEQGFNLDDVLPWTDVCFFVSLFLKDQHCLVPVVHKPTFSQDVLNRRDRRDEAFRGLLCSMVAYTICQCPISTMTGAYERPRLVTILHRCSRAAESIRHRHRMVPSLVGLASTVLDWITAHAIGNPQVCDIHAAEATRLAHALSLADPHARSTTNGKRTDLIEREIRRRLFWIIYSKDKTDALSGRPIILHDFEGVAPFPLEVDDDYITTEGYLPQPARRASYMLGFVTIMRVFQIVSQCVTRHRSFANGHRAGTMGADADVFVAAGGGRSGGAGPGSGSGSGGGEPGSGSSDTNDANASSAEAAPLLRWIHSARSRLHTILEDLPPALNNTMADLTEAVRDLDPPADISLFGIQQANITITALCAEFALLDLRASLCPHEDTRAERDDMARKAYDALASIPYEYLASNGESMRGKVLRIVLSLLSMTPEPDRFSQSVWDWWNVFSSFQFLQVIPDETMLLIDQGGGGAGAGAAKKVAHGAHHHGHGQGQSPKVSTA